MYAFTRACSVIRVSFSLEAAANVLTIDALDPQTKIPEYKICAVKIEPATATELEQTLQMT